MGVVDEALCLFRRQERADLHHMIGMTSGFGEFPGLPNVFIVMALLVGLYAFISERTTAGRRIYAIGGNAKAAKLVGINGNGGGS